MRRPNILLVVLDATRADACSCFGNEHLTTPILDEVAEQGVLFEQAFSPAPWTLPAMASVFSGLYPSQTDVYSKLALSPTYPALAELLSHNGYATFCVTNNSWLSADFGLQRGFDKVHKQWQRWQTQHDVTKSVLLERARNSSWTRVVAQELAQGNVVKNVVNAAFHRLRSHRHDKGASRILRPVTRWISSQENPWFALVHYLEAHLPYRPPVKLAAGLAGDARLAKEWMRADQWRAAWRHIAGVEVLSAQDLGVWRELYRAEVAYADYHLGLLLGWLQHAGLLDDTLVIIVADHGESLGEHGLLNHQYCVYDTLLHVPLVMRYPAVLPQAHRVSHQVQTLDLFKTILDFAGAEAPPSASRNLLSGSERRQFTVAEYGAPRAPHPSYLTRFGLKWGDLERFERGLVAIRSDTHKLVVDTQGSVELFAWREDPGEERELSAEHPETVRELQDELRKWHGEIGAVLADGAEHDWAIDAKTTARLEALGYLG